MNAQPTKEQMAEQIRQKLTETIFWLHQVAGTLADQQAVSDIKQVIADLERLDMSVADAFKSAEDESKNK